MTAQVTGLLLILIAMAVESFAQLALKVGAAGGAAVLAGRFRDLAERRPLTRSPRTWILAGVISYGLEIVFYTLALNCLEVSVAFPLGSLCFVGVAILSKVFLGEAVGAVRWLGVACILAGTVFLAL